MAKLVPGGHLKSARVRLSAKGKKWPKEPLTLGVDLEKVGVVTVEMAMKGYKVTEKSRRKMIGVACDSLKQLLVKGREKLGVAEDVVAALEDGTIVDDEEYFRGLPAQTVIVLYRKNEEIVTGMDFILNALRSVNTSYLETGSKAKEFVIARANELMEILRENQNEDKDRIAKNTPQEDPDWFSGLETNARTKDEYMFKKSQDRIRGYFYKFQEDMRRNDLFVQDPGFRGVVLQCLDFLRNRLKKDEFFGCYFDRRCAPETPLSQQDRLQAPASKKSRKQKTPEREQPTSGYDRLSYCDRAGNFVCQGKWRSERCEFFADHRINPYLSRETRIMFSTWNLDHRCPDVAGCFFFWTSPLVWHWKGHAAPTGKARSLKGRRNYKGNRRCEHPPEEAVRMSNTVSRKTVLGGTLYCSAARKGDFCPSFSGSVIIFKTRLVM